MKFEEFIKRYAQSLIALMIGLIVIYFVLNWLHLHGGPVAGPAGKVGTLASGQSYHFGG